LTDIYAQLASDRDAKAHMCALYVLEKEWDRASQAAREFEVLQGQCSVLVVGSLASWDSTDPDIPPDTPRAA
jgi:lipopolysaccharide biosynthesis regulator YciM